MAELKLELVTNDRWPVIRLRNPIWESMRGDMQKIPEMSPVIRDDREIEVGKFDSDYYDESGNCRSELPNWFNLWYHYMGPMMEAVLPELYSIYGFGSNDRVVKPHEWNIWCQSYSEKGHHGGHSHGYGSISACQYIKFIPGEHLATTFYHIPPNPFSGNTLSVTPEIEEGDVIFFPSTYLHSSNVNTSEHQRAIVAWNMKVENPTSFQDTFLNP